MPLEDIIIDGTMTTDKENIVKPPWMEIKNHSEGGIVKACNAG